MRALLAPLALFWCGCSSLFSPFSSDNPDNCNHYPEVCDPQQVCDESLGRCVTPDFFPASVDCSEMALIAALQSAMAQANSSLTLTPGCTYTLSTANNFWYGPNALPPVTSDLTLEGQGATLERSGAPGTPKMRLLYVAMTRARDHLELIVPQRFYVTGQAGSGDRHVYASRTRFIPNRLLDRFASRSWPPVEPAVAGTPESRQQAIDLAARMRAMWR